jgi:hypothetical protein
MPLIAYEDKNLRPWKLDVIDTINTILAQYTAQGYDLTVRQLYYQFVAHDLFPADRTFSQSAQGRWVRDPAGTPNAEPNYDWLQDIVDDGRMNGLIDWHHIVDRTRASRSTQHWNDPGEIVDATANSFKLDLWERQGDYVEVWVEKDALIGVLENVCRELDVTHFASRGYNSQSNMWGASRRILEQIKAGKKVTILHLSDHDPSGVDMTRDANKRLWTFVAMDYFRHLIDEGEAEVGSPEDRRRTVQYVNDHFRVKRIALTMAQVQQYNPPPNPAKISDSRAASYIDTYGPHSWELDALDPPVLNQLIRSEIEALIDDTIWAGDIKREQQGQKRLRQLSRAWPLMDKHWAQAMRYIDSLDGDSA